MQRAVAICGALLVCAVALSLEPRAAVAGPTQFEIGVHTFIDMGPPFDFYEVYVVHSTPNGASVERIRLTPAGNPCLQPAEVEVAKTSMHARIADLLGSMDPCAIPEKALRQELSRGKKGLVFSGANVLMEVQCGARTRFIRSEILDRDMFDAAPHTPQYTSWTMRLLEKLEKPFGPGVLDRPIFPTLAQEKRHPETSDAATIKDILAGVYDGLFPGAPDKPSELCREAEKPPPPPPSVRLVSSEPLHPASFALPGYPPLARLVEVEGKVSLKVGVSADGTVTQMSVESGHPLLGPAAKDAVSRWKFPKGAQDRQTQVTLDFKLNCHAKARAT